MDIIVIDRDSLANQLLTSKLEARGHKVTCFQNKNGAFDAIRNGNFDCVMVDPAPLAEPKPVIVAIWRNLPPGVRPYMLLLSKDATAEQAVLAGANDVLNKPISTQDIEDKLGNAARLMEIVRHLAHEDDVHSGGGMIGKAAFNQLFLSATDRAFRYGEKSLIVFLHFANHDEIAAQAGAEAAEKAVAQLSERMTFMRRQSDVIGRLGCKDFAILLQRPQFEAEPIDAINRFAEVLDKFHHSFPDRALAPRIELHLVEIPQGALHAERAVPLAQAEAVQG
jgi:PleD family two-component response regulator